MPAKPRRRAPQRRKPVKVRRRPRWIVRVVLMAASLFVVFCVAAGATLWFSGSRRPTPPAALPGAAGSGEQFTGEEREALDNLLKERKSDAP